jgi:hypothetical protein
LLAEPKIVDREGPEGMTDYIRGVIYNRASAAQVAMYPSRHLTEHSFMICRRPSAGAYSGRKAPGLMTNPCRITSPSSPRLTRGQKGVLLCGRGHRARRFLLGKHR